MHSYRSHKVCYLCLGPIGDFCIGDGKMYNYTRDASRCLAILSINTSRLFAEGSVIPPEHHLMLVNFHRECIGDPKKSPVGPSHYEAIFDLVRSMFVHKFPHKPLHCRRLNQPPAITSMSISRRVLWCLITALETYILRFE